MEKQHQRQLFSIIVNNLINMKVSLKENTQQSQIPVEQAKKDKKPAYFELKNYPHDGICQQLAFMLIRPPRFVYNPDILKPNKRNIQRFTAQTVNIGFQLTIYKQKEMRYVVLYLHGNGSSRFEGCLFLHSIPDKVGIACFDFNGCGNRQEAQYITLGQKQSKDVDKAAKYLKQQGYVVVGWGRSMGAVSLLTSNELDIIVADSAYSNLTYLCKQTSSKFLPKACCCIVHIFFPCIFCCIQNQVEKLSGLQIGLMDIQKHLAQISKNRIKKSICFIHGEQDALVPSNHAQTLYDAYEGRKMLIFFEGTHNSTRPDEVIKKCFQFIQQSLDVNRSELQGQYLAQNNKLGKMIELQQINKGFMKTDHSQVDKSKLLTEKQNVNQNKREYIHLQTSYSNGPSKVSGISPDTREEYLEGGLKVDIDLSQDSSPELKPKSFLKAAKNDDFQLFPSFQGNMSMQNHVKKQVTIQKIFKTKQVQSKV